MAPGDTVYLQSGEYRENILIDISIVLIGKNQPLIRGGYTGHVIKVTAPGTVIDGLKVSEAGTKLIDDMACIRVEADSVTVRNCIITESLHGIYVKGGSYATINDNVIEGRLDLIEADRGNGIHLWNSRLNHLNGNEIFHVRDGIYFSFADSTMVSENYIHHVRYDLHYMYSDVNEFVENRFEDNVAGAALMYSKKIYFYRNIFARCRGFRAYGILYQSLDYSVAEGNLVIDNSRGVFFDDSNQNVFRNNDVVDNDLAMQLNASCDDNVLVQNNFLNNLSNLIVDGKESRTAWTNESGGNYWSNYRGYDLDKDGIGDIPHRLQNVFQIMEIDVPEVRFYLFSPAAEILEVAERTLPILDLGTERDPQPIMHPIDNNEGPWYLIDTHRLGASPLFASAYLLAALLPILITSFLTRRRRGR